MLSHVHARYAFSINDFDFVRGEERFDYFLKIILEQNKIKELK